jgi:hypothetical protein
MHFNRYLNLMALCFCCAVLSSTAGAGSAGFQGQLQISEIAADAVLFIDGVEHEITTGTSNVFKLDQGQHLIQFFKSADGIPGDLIAEDRIEIPGGGIVRITCKDDAIEVENGAPVVKESINIVQSFKDDMNSRQSSQTVTGLASATDAPITSVNAGNGETGLIVSVTPIAAAGYAQQTTIFQPNQSNNVVVQVMLVNSSSTNIDSDQNDPVSASSSKLLLITEYGGCDVYLDGIKEISIGATGGDQPATGVISNLKSGTHHLKITGSDTWYEGTFITSDSEELKISVDPGIFRVVSRTPIF